MVMDLDVAVVRIHAQAALVFGEGCQGETLQEWYFLSIISYRSGFNHTLDTHNLIIVCLFFRNHLSHVIACSLVYLKISDLEVDVLQATLHEAFNTEIS